MSDSTQPLGHALRDACKAFVEAMETFELSTEDGYNTQGCLSAVVGCADNVKEAAEHFFTVLEDRDNQNVHGIITAAMDSAYIRQDETKPWLRIDSVDKFDSDEAEIMVHNENTEADCDQTLIATELDPTQVEFMKLVPFKLTKKS